MIARYAVFAGEGYYSSGGATNLLGWAASLADAWVLVDEVNAGQHESCAFDWCHALDVETGSLIARNGWEQEGHGEGIKQRWSITSDVPAGCDNVRRFKVELDNALRGIGDGGVHADIVQRDADWWVQFRRDIRKS